MKDINVVPPCRYRNFSSSLRMTLNILYNAVIKKGKECVDINYKLGPSQNFLVPIQISHNMLESSL